MRQAFIFCDEKSDKFWTIDYSGLDLCVHYGKTGTIGKYEIKEFDDVAACEKEAKRLIASKLKKGYREEAAFDFEDCIYVDDDEIGLHPKTSHPHFVAHFTADFYYDCADEETPFGSDEGSDCLYSIEERLRKNPKLDFSAVSCAIIEKDWGMCYLPADDLSPEKVAQLAKKQQMDMQQSDMVTYAAAFAQIKTTGKLNAGLKQQALNAIQRYAMVYNEGGRLTEIQQTMYEDLCSFSA